MRYLIEACACTESGDVVWVNFEGLVEEHTRFACLVVAAPLTVILCG